MNKKDKIPLVPKLRFPEFCNEWEIKTFDETFEFHQTNTFSRSEMNAEKGKVRNIHYGDILTKYGSVIDDTSIIPFLNDDVNFTRFRNCSYLQNGDVIISDTAEDLTAGKTVEIQNVDCDVLAGLHTMLCRPKYKTAPKFFGYYLNSPAYHNSLIPLITGTKVCSISKSNISKTLVSTPSFTEQQKIADCLSSIDDLITAEEKKLEALKVYKKGLMQKLFPADGETVPKWRFPEFRNSSEWVLRPIGEEVDLLTGYPFKSEEISQNATGTPLLRGINISEGFIRHNQDIDRFFLGEVKDLEKYRLQTNDLVIGMDGSKVGKNCALVTEADSGALLIQRVARLRANSVSTISFIFHQINSSKFHTYVNRINTSGGIPHISAQQIRDFEIYFPMDVKEQQKIAVCLSELDTLITTQAQKVESLRDHKKGLMQGLFPSIRR